jgi:hypothetical protein
MAKLQGWEMNMRGMRKERKGKRIYRGENEATGNENTKEIVML